MLASLALSIGLARLALAQPPTNNGIPPLASLRFNYTNLPYQVDPAPGIRGPQSGYNRCNSTTEGPHSLCQTAFVNHIDDFCLWSAPEPNSEIGNIEHEAVAWCTKPGRGTRIIPEGALTAVQFLRAPAYVQVTGRIKQEFINLKPEDYGGEMDPHGADLRGNPVGGLVFSNAFASNGGNNNSFQQVIEWHNFMGGGVFCMKACDPAGAQDERYCEHIFDRIGCQYNAPAAYAENQFLSCDSENQDFPGVYVDPAGATQTYRQPPESLGPITTVPYTARIPATSNCVTYTSSVLYSALNSAAPATTTSASATTTSPGSSSTGSSTSSGSTPSQTANSASGLVPGFGAAAAVMLASFFAVAL